MTLDTKSLKKFMNSTFHLEIITPERVAFSNEVEMITAQSADGEIGILPAHVPLFSRLVEGEIKIIQKGEESYLAIGGGFLQVVPGKVIILVTAAYHAHEINEQEMLMAKKRAQEALTTKPTGEALFAIESMIRRSEVALKVLHRRKTGRTSLPS